MRFFKLSSVLVTVLIVFSCKQTEKSSKEEIIAEEIVTPFIAEEILPEEDTLPGEDTLPEGDTLSEEVIQEQEEITDERGEETLLNIEDYSDVAFVRLNDFSKDFLFDLKYATEDNFLNAKVYDCGECYLRAKAVKALLKANKDFMRLSYRIKLFDCYRPLDTQKKMWRLLPNTIYVASPMKGSIHNRGGAVDLTLVNDLGEELDMGTPFDYFGPEAHHNYKDLPEDVLAYRELLKEIMLKHNFRPINSEWWHYYLYEAADYPVSNFKWGCE